MLQGLQSSNPISLVSLDYLYYRDSSPPTLYLWYPWTIYITGTLVLQPYISDIPGLFILQGLQSSNPISDIPGLFILQGLQSSNPLSLISLDYLFYRDSSPPTLYPWYPWTIYIKGPTVLQPYIPDIPGLFILKGLQSSNPISLISLDYLYYRDYRPPTLYSDIPGLFILKGLQSSNPISLIYLDYLYYRGCSPPTLYP